MPRSITAALSLVIGASALAADPFAADVRPTPALSPQEEQKAFHLPPGFEMQLVAAEPDIAKPMNLAFDGGGRLWVTTTREYPFPAPHDRKPRDEIKIIELGRDGHATKITTFADGLNIPIGLYPTTDGGCIAFSIPEIRRYYDDEHDGRADRSVKLYGTFGDNDTHGMTNAFRRGCDGWLYACHGFNNVSTIIASDGSSITLNSGNTFRCKLDGSHVEQFTHGQTNPFGLCFDPLGNLYSADSHSKPIYQLLRGGYYEGIGKTDEGLGFAPPMMQHSHGSTAIGGVVFYAADDFPTDFRGNMFVGNVVTSRINRDSISYNGSSPAAHEEPDFVRSGDPWFRPCDLQLGPDGAIYVADFYNRIIGHYEVPLDHPGRDRERGRIWRIVYRGDTTSADKARDVASRSHERQIVERSRDLGTSDIPQLIDGLNDPNLTVRRLATDQLTDRIGAPAIEPLKKLITNAKTSPRQTIQAMWVLHELGALELRRLEALASDASSDVRVHAMRVLAEDSNWIGPERGLALRGLTDADPLVRRCAADALGRRPQPENVPPLLALMRESDAADTHLRYVARMALRDQLQSSGGFASVDALKLTNGDLRAILDVVVAAPTPESAAFIVRHLGPVANDRTAMLRCLRHAMKFAADDETVNRAVTSVRTMLAEDLDLQMELFAAAQEATTQRGRSIEHSELRLWGEQLARQVLHPRTNDGLRGWTLLPLDGPTPTTAPSTAPSGESAAQSPNPWSLQWRRSADGDADSLFLSSLPSGETLTGVIRSPVFTTPRALSFWIAGHNGFPKHDPPPKNRVRLRDAETGELLAEALPPRNDVAQRVTWDLHEHAGRRGYLEAIDGDTNVAYAWLAFGRLDPPVAPLPAMLPGGASCARAAEIAGALRLTDLADDLQRVADDAATDPATRAAAAITLAKFGRDGATAILSQIVRDTKQPTPLRDTVARNLGEMDSAAARDALVAAFADSTSKLQTLLARSLASTRAGASALLDAIANNKASPRLLQEQTIADAVLASGVPNAQPRMAQLTKDLPPVHDELDKIIERRRGTFALATLRRQTSPGSGAKVFAQNCAVCHRIAGEGKLVGPQLDGIETRGADRLIEDVLDPNRNVDPSFRYSTIQTADGQSITGLFRRDDGAALVFVDATGREVAVAKDKIKRRIDSASSLMPDNFSSAIPPEDFNDLIAYLLTK